MRSLLEAILRFLVLLFHAVGKCIDAGDRIERVLCFLGVHTLCAAAPCSQWTLPLLPASVDDKLTVVLDLDETLVCAYQSSLLSPRLHKRAVLSGIKWFQMNCIASDENGKDVKVNDITVYERPGLREFLEKTSVFAELVVFTAGQEGYAKPVIDMIDPENRISSRLYRTATSSTRCREHVKDLSRLGRDLRRTVIIDNNPCSFLLQPLNGIPCVPFTAENPRDDQLNILLPLLELLSSKEDVRPVLDQRFHMNSWFRVHGVY